MSFDAAVAGIDHNERTRIGGHLGCRTHAGFTAKAQTAVLHGDIAQEAVAVGGGKIEHQPRRLAGGRGERESLVHPHRPFGVEHDARTALHDQAEAERLDQPAATKRVCLSSPPTRTSVATGSEVDSGSSDNGRAVTRGSAAMATKPPMRHTLKTSAIARTVTNLTFPPLFTPLGAASVNGT